MAKPIDPDIGVISVAANKAFARGQVEGASRQFARQFIDSDNQTIEIFLGPLAVLTNLAHGLRLLRHVALQRRDSLDELDLNAADEAFEGPGMSLFDLLPKLAGYLLKASRDGLLDQFREARLKRVIAASPTPRQIFRGHIFRGQIFRCQTRRCQIFRRQILPAERFLQLRIQPAPRIRRDGRVSELHLGDTRVDLIQPVQNGPDVVRQSAHDFVIMLIEIGRGVLPDSLAKAQKVVHRRCIPPPAPRPRKAIGAVAGVSGPAPDRFVLGQTFAPGLFFGQPAETSIPPQLRREILAAVMDVQNRVDEVPRRAILQQVAIATRLNKFADDLFILRACVDNDLDGREPETDTPDKLDAVNAGEVQIHESDLRSRGFYLAKRGFAIAGDSRYFESWMGRKKRFEPVAAQCVSVGQQNPDFVGLTHFPLNSSV